MLGDERSGVVEQDLLRHATEVPERAFQALQGLKVDGSVGPATRGAFGKTLVDMMGTGTLKRGNAGSSVRAMQQALNITTPDSGVLLDDMLFADGATVSKGRFIQPRIEAEIAFVMRAPLCGLDVTRADVIAATDYVSPSLEILDTRILRADPATGRARVIYDTVADNAANAGIVLGAERHDVTAHDLRWVGAIVKRDGVVEETGLGAGVLDDPVTGILWLVHRLAAYGAGISAGDIVLSGSFIRPLEAPSGSVFEANFGAFGRVDLRFA